MSWNLKGGVIIIGSLFWQDYLHKPGDNVRVNWRNTYLDIKNKIPVKVPIRYGRVSTKSGSIPTMVFSNKMKRKPGFGYVIPFNQRIQHAEEMVAACNALCTAEGINEGFIANWGVLGYMINKSRMGKDPTKAIKKIFKDRVTKFLVVNEYKIGREKSCISKSLELTIPWVEPISGNDQSKIDEFDFLLATATKPTTPSPAIQKIAQLIKSDTVRKYFMNNIENGIITQEDFSIVKHL